MRVIHIYVEGKTDLTFISQFLKKHYQLHFECDFKVPKANCVTENVQVQILTIETKYGSGGINSKNILALIDEIKIGNEPIGVESIVLLDADTPAHNNPKGGFADRAVYCENMVSGTGIRYFLIPNHQDDGSLEDVLHNVVSDKGKVFYQCLSSYIGCLASIQENKPVGLQQIEDFKKTKFDWYTYIMLGNGTSKKDFLDTQIWDLDTPELEKLRTFFNTYFG